MSALIALAQEATTLTAATGVAPFAPGDGVLDMLTTLNTETLTVLRALAITLAVVFVIWQAVVSRMAMARIIVATLAAGIFVWAVLNVTAVKDLVNNELNATGATTSHVEPV